MICLIMRVSIILKPAASRIRKHADSYLCVLGCKGYLGTGSTNTLSQRIARRPRLVLRISSREVVVILLRERKEKKRTKATSCVEKQTPGMHRQHPGISGNERGQHRRAQDSRVYIEQCKK